MKVSILMLTYNAPKYVYESITTLRKVTSTDIPYELIVVDNDSHFVTQCVDRYLYRKGMIDKLQFNDENQLFARGNNTASKLVDRDSTLYLLLNSDVRINNAKWLDNLIAIYPKEGGIASYGVVDSEPCRADGYCMLIDRRLYDKYQLDESYEWWWSVTGLEAQVLQNGRRIVAVRNHEDMIHHYGGKSGKGFKSAKGMDVDMDVVKNWFSNGSANLEIIDSLQNYKDIMDSSPA